MKQSFDNIRPDSRFRDDWKILRSAIAYKSGLIVIVAALMLTAQYYLASLGVIRTYIHQPVPQSLSWCGLIVLFYLMIPVMLIKLILRENLKDYGLHWHQLHRHGKIYALLLSVMIPVIVAVSFQAHFKNYYPFFNYASESMAGFILWELSYGLHFLAVEFFFRGFLIFGLASKIGPYAILFSTVPYCMVHFGKPAGEAMGAIFAGLALGYLAWKNRSIWGGALLHWGVAIAMDLAATLQKIA
jgi:membrane protease YdiL (CAAX protease family)